MLHRTIAEAYRKAQRRLFLLDYDGTLVPIAPTPDLAMPTPAVQALLQNLANDPHNTVVIVSGRPKDSLGAWLGHLPVYLVAEHGSFKKPPQGEWEQTITTEDGWREAIQPILATAAASTPDSFLEQKQASVVWHHRLGDPGLAKIAQVEALSRLAAPAKKYDLNVVPGRKTIEVRAGGANKGKVAASWLKEAWDFILAAGDEASDEDLFKAMPPQAFSIKLGPGDTAASHHLPSVAALIQLLEQLDG